LSGSVTQFTDASRCRQSPPRFARPFGEVQRQFLRAGGYRDARIVDRAMRRERRTVS
jgi:hypothetical protein